MWYVIHPLTDRRLYVADTYDEAIAWVEQNARGLIVRVSQSKEKEE